jgi:flagellar basal-body rod protein FlgC
MISSVNNSAQAIKAFGTGTAVTANNVANVETENFKSSRAVMNEGDNGGVKVTLSQETSPGPLVTQSDGSARELSNTDLASEFTDMISFQSGYDANIKTVQTADEMKGSVIDMIA